jgi:hypothetical protein
LIDRVLDAWRSQGKVRVRFDKLVWRLKLAS